MLPRRLRLSKNADILKVMRQGSKLSTAYVWIYFLQNTKNKSSRVACIVSKKVHKSAVKRHYYQRWLRSLSSAYISRLPAAYDMVWVARPSIIEVNAITKLQDSFQAQLDNLLERLKKISTSQSAN